MIRKNIGIDAISVVAEDSDDLLSLRRVIKIGDRIVSDTARTIKRDKEFTRPGKGERIKIRIALNVERISLDHMLDRLRVSGTILESNSESVSHGSHHSLVLKINDRFVISKKRWSAAERRLLESSGSRTGFVLLAIDTSDCGIARLKGTHLEFLPNIYSGAGGKRYKTSFDIEKFFEQIRHAMVTISAGTDMIIIFGPGETKKRFANFLQKEGSCRLQVVEGIDSGGEDGIYTFAKSQIMKETISESKLAKVSLIIDEIMLLAKKKSRRFTMGFEDAHKANQMGAVKLLVFSDKSIQEYGEDRMIELLNSAEGNGAETFGVDSSTDLGLRVTGLGGIVSLLRYAMGD